MSDSAFFGDALFFEWLSAVLLPDIAREKKSTGDLSLRIWSAGCAQGEEPYSLAILIREISESEKIRFQTSIIATDTDEESLKLARETMYPSEKVFNIKYGLLKKYFALVNGAFRLIPEIRRSVHFSLYDLADPATSAPPESVFGSFDLIMCRNVLIHNPEKQEIILEKLLHSLAPRGFLILGQAEDLLKRYRRHFRKMEGCCSVFQKTGR